jgi:hypothetical protein
VSGDADIRLLWTGGWDSTFRLLTALLIHRKTVQPYYLKDQDDRRPSTAIEMRVMEQIAGAIAARSAEAAGRLRKPIIHVADIRTDDQVFARFQRLRARSYIGDQYAWLARFAIQQDLSDLELAIHQDDKAHGFLQSEVVREDGGGDPYYRLRDNPADADLRIFERFRFPIFNMTKLEMERVARDRGFRDIMEMTWFCHMPTRRGRPCGCCHPCQYTIEEGLGWRVPLPGRLNYYGRKLLKRILPDRLQHYARQLLRAVRRWRAAAKKWAGPTGRARAP